MNNTNKSISEFIQKCNESEEFFYEEYIRKQPANKNLQPYTPERFQNYMNMAKDKHQKFKSENTFLRQNNFRSYPLKPQDCFYTPSKVCEIGLNGKPII